MAISTPGIGSGLDVNTIVSQLVALEKQPLQQLQTKSTSIQSKLSAFGRLKSELATLQSAITKLNTSSSWGVKSLTSNNTSLTGAATSSAANGTYEMQVSQLAQRQVTNSGAYTTGSAGRLEIRIGQWTDANTFSSSATAAVVDIDSTDDLSAIATKINAANAGVTASVINSSNGPRLAVKGSSTGAASGFEIKAFDTPVSGGSQITDGETGVGALGFASANPGISPPVGMTRPINGLAQDAKVLIDGMEVSSSTNVFNSPVNGVTLTATATTTSPFQVTIANNQSAVKENIESFVTAFNKISTSLTELTKYDAANSKSSTLQGDSAAVGLQNTLKRIATGAGTGSTAFARLSDMGVELQRDGTLKVNSTKLTTALEQPDQLSAFFLDASGMAANLKSFANGALGTEGLIASRNQALQTASTRNTKEVERVNARAALVEKRLLQQYSQLDTKVATNQSLNSLVTQWVSSMGS